MKKNKKLINIVLLLMVVVLIVIPMVLNPSGEYSGTDQNALGMIEEVAPNYEPWYEVLWAPPSGEIESLMFTIFASSGAAVLAYFIGYKKGQLAVSKAEPSANNEGITTHN